MKVDPRLNEIKDCMYRVAVKAVVVRDRKVLLVQDHEDKGWTFPGGGVDHSEYPLSALRRELSEEIGVNTEDIECDDRIVSVTMGQMHNGVPRCNLHYLVTLKTDSIRPTQEVIKMDWIEVEKLENEIFDSTAGNIDEIVKIVKSLT